MLARNHLLFNHRKKVFLLIASTNQYERYIRLNSCRFSRMSRKYDFRDMYESLMKRLEHDYTYSLTSYDDRRNRKFLAENDSDEDFENTFILLSMARNWEETHLLPHLFYKMCDVPHYAPAQAWRFPRKGRPPDFDAGTRHHAKIRLSVGRRIILWNS